ncbi:MAG: BON domain-containing protein [Gemmatimonadetes bacterium]|nr:BON domain-containing protein [Gemmatimonadota bacterium]
MAIGLGALATGLLLSRRGRRLVREALQGRRRTRLEDRVLDALWGDRVLGRRRIDVEEASPGRIVLRGEVRDDAERRRAVALAGRVHDVDEVEDLLTLGAEIVRSSR